MDGFAKEVQERAENRWKYEANTLCSSAEEYAFLLMQLGVKCFPSKGKMMLTLNGLKAGIKASKVRLARKVRSGRLLPAVSVLQELPIKVSLSKIGEGALSMEDLYEKYDPEFQYLFEFYSAGHVSVGVTFGEIAQDSEAMSEAEFYRFLNDFGVVDSRMRGMKRSILGKSEAIKIFSQSSVRLAGDSGPFELTKEAFRSAILRVALDVYKKLPQKAIKFSKGAWVEFDTFPITKGGKTLLEEPCGAFSLTRAKLESLVKKPLLFDAFLRSEFKCVVCSLVLSAFCLYLFSSHLLSLSLSLSLSPSSYLCPSPSVAARSLQDWIFTREARCEDE